MPRFDPAQLPYILLNIPVKLNGDNYHRWKSIMVALLRAYGLLGYADGSIAAPSETFVVDEELRRFGPPPNSLNKEIPNPEYKKWVIQDQFTLAVLLLSVNAQVGVDLIGVTSSRQAWTTLAQLFETQSFDQAELLEQRWRELQKGGSAMLDYLRLVKQLSTRLALRGKPQSQQQINQRIVSGLSDEWEPLALALAPSLRTMTTDEVGALLLDREAHRTHLAAAEPSPPPSGLTGPGAGFSSPGSLKSGPSSSSPHGPAFMPLPFISSVSQPSGIGPSSTASQQPGPGQWAPPPCQLCFQAGHTAISCQLLPADFFVASSS